MNKTRKLCVIRARGSTLALLAGTGKRDGSDFYFYETEKLQAHRSGPWKLKLAFKGKVYGKEVEHPELLFNLEDDPGEQHNLADKHPDVVKRLKAQMADFEKKLGPVPKPKT